ncbi:dihydroneopterin aldolase [Sulfurospirillum sp. 1612]|uniref:dihydroneopterin aldolase n=1 Tax=Sulfurospirillum sp. 1612 TaxID=3094835 RepID=UPI002F9315C7
MTIFIKNFEFDAILGLLDTERHTKQRIIVDAKIHYQYSNSNFIDYSQVTKIIQETIMRRKFLLIEEALEEIITILSNEFPKIEKIKLKISKPDIISNCVVGAIIKRKLKIY